jgi:hypothetical protein
MLASIGTPNTGANLIPIPSYDTAYGSALRNVVTTGVPHGLLFEQPASEAAPRSGPEPSLEMLASIGKCGRPSGESRP